MIKNSRSIVARHDIDRRGLGSTVADRSRAPRSAAGGSSTAGEGSGRIRSIALFQNVSQAPIEEAAKGVLAGLAAAGFAEGPSFRIRRYNAEGDAATLNSIAQAIIGGDDDLVITLSTPSLQAFAAANRDANRPHVFGMVSDPAASGVGIARDDPRKHPPYMVGMGTMQPVAETFRLARRLAPRLKRVGVAWNPSEANSEACTKVAQIRLQRAGNRTARGHRGRLGVGARRGRLAGGAWR